MRTRGSISASMWMMQQPSAPNAVAIVSRGWNTRTAQRRISCGVAWASLSLAAAIHSSEKAGWDIVTPNGKSHRLPGELQYLYHYYEDCQGTRSARRVLRGKM